MDNATKGVKDASGKVVKNFDGVNNFAKAADGKFADKMGKVMQAGNTFMTAGGMVAGKANQPGVARPRGHVMTGRAQRRGLR